MKCLAVVSPSEDGRTYYYFSKLYPEMGPEEIRGCPLGSCAVANLLATAIYFGAIAVGGWAAQGWGAVLMSLFGLALISYARVRYCNHIVNLRRKRVYFITLLLGFWATLAGLRTLGPVSLGWPGDWIWAAVIGMLLAVLATWFTDRSRRERLAATFMAWQSHQLAA